jgi:hypothetical protein
MSISDAIIPGGVAAAGTNDSFRSAATSAAANTRLGEFNR